VSNKESASVVLILSERTELLEALCQEVLSLGFTPFPSNSSTEASKLVQTNKIDLVILDFQTTEAETLQLVRGMRAFSRELPIVAICPSVIPFVESLYQAGADVVHQMPYDKTVLEKTIRRFLSDENQQNSRIYRRHDIQLDIFWRSPQEAQYRKGQTLNLSAGGIFIVENQILPKEKDIVNFNFESGRGDSKVILGRGLVRWVRPSGKDFCPSGYGLEFIGFDPGSKRSLETLLSLLSNVE
jgi:DNA-binding response OmpR family regulator